MTGAELKTLTEELNGGRTIGDTLFYQLANRARNRVENLRPWRWLVKEDSSKTALASDTFATAKALPSDFRKPFNARFSRTERGSVILRTGDSKLIYKPIPFAARQDNKDNNGLYVIDYPNSNLYLMGSVDQTYTIYLYYIKKSLTITSSQGWEFPDEFHELLAHDIARIQKGNIDYDDTNARMAPFENAGAQEILNGMILWDDDLQRAELGA